MNFPTGICNCKWQDCGLQAAGGRQAASGGHPRREVPASLLPEGLASADMAHEVSRVFAIT